MRQNEKQQDKRKHEIRDLEKRISELPAGYISRKMIRGKERWYLQWREGAKVRSRYIKAAEKEQVQAQITERKKLQAQLKELRREHRFEFRAPESSMVAETQTFDTEGSKQRRPAFAEDPIRFLKWQDTVIGEVDADYNVFFLEPELNKTVWFYTDDKNFWSRQELIQFLEGRIVSPGRRDIEQILRRCNLTEYDPLKIGLITKGICARDLLWIAETEDEKLEDAFTEVFDKIFHQRIDQQGDTIDTPEGQNVKRYAVRDGQYGILKQRISPITADMESELAVAALAQRLGIPCCPCCAADEDTVFSRFCYNFAEEYIVHFRQLLRRRISGNELENLLSVRPQYLADFARMITLDFITRQDDRHLSNIAVKISASGESFYPLYDNGRSLFYEDTEETVQKACRDIPAFATAFGAEGNYLDYVRQLSGMGISFTKLMDLDIGPDEVGSILKEAGFKEYRLAGAQQWICECLSLLRELG